MASQQEIEGGIKRKELVAVEVEIGEVSGAGVIEQVAICAHATILVLYSQLFFGDDMVGCGIDFYELLIGYFPVEFAQYKLIPGQGYGFGEATGAEPVYAGSTFVQGHGNDSGHIVPINVNEGGVDGAIEVCLQRIPQSFAQGEVYGMWMLEVIVGADDDTRIFCGEEQLGTGGTADGLYAVSGWHIGHRHNDIGKDGPVETIQCFVGQWCGLHQEGGDANGYDQKNSEGK